MALCSARVSGASRDKMGPLTALAWNGWLEFQSETISLSQSMRGFPAFLSLGGGEAPQPPRYTPILPIVCCRIIPLITNMTTLPSWNGGPSLSHDPCQYGISNTRTNNNTSNRIHGNANQNIGNVLNSYNNTITVGISEEASRIQRWLSPLEPHARHQDVRNRRLDGVGNWVLGEDEFESWRKSQDSSANRTLLCYGDQGAGKTYIR